MVRFLRSFSVEILTVLLMSFVIYFLLSGITWFVFFIKWVRNFQIEDSQWKNISTIFLSIFVEGLPFILIGVFVSSFIHIFVKEEIIYKLQMDSEKPTAFFAVCCQSRSVVPHL